MATNRTMILESPRSLHQRAAAIVIRAGLVLLLGSAGLLLNTSIVLAQAGTKIVAKVGTTVITAQSFEDYLSRAQRKRFYHGVPAGDQTQQVRREVADELIHRILLLQEAKQRGFNSDQAAIQKTLDYYDKRYANEPRWRRDRVQMLNALRTQAEEEDLLRQLETQVRQIAPPSENQLVAYYRANPDKFTEPTRDRISLILLAVAPSAEAAVWQAAREQANNITAQLQRGANFAELARLHSADPTAQNGGDMGYLHRGMLSPQADAAVERLRVGEMTESIKVLEGIAIFHLVERRPAQQLTFQAVRERARGLWLREHSESAWQNLRQTLRANTPVTFYDASLRS